MHCCLENPVAFYALTYASGQHLAHMQNNHNRRSYTNLLLLSYKTQAVRLINDALTNLNGQPIPDAVLIAILSLGAHGNGHKRTLSGVSASTIPGFNKPWPPNNTISAMRIDSIPSLKLSLNPLSRAQMLHFYGGIDQETAHMSAVRTLIKHNKGIADIELPGLKGAVELGDLLDSTIMHTAPCIPAPHPLTATFTQFLPDPNDDTSTPRLLLLPVDALPDTHASLELVSAFTTARAVGLGLEAHVAACTKSPGLALEASLSPITHRRCHNNQDEAYTPQGLPTLTDLTISRNAAHHALLSLPAANAQWSECFARYESARVASLIFANLVLFPLPEATGVNARYARMLRHAMDGLKDDAEPMTSDQEKKARGKRGGLALGDTKGVENVTGPVDVNVEFIFWCAAMGALAAQGSMEKAWFLAWWKESAPALGIGSWSVAREVLERWLWWEYLFGVPGEAMWDAAIGGGGGGG
jgi:hypothetical protein